MKIASLLGRFGVKTFQRVSVQNQVSNVDLAFHNARDERVGRDALATLCEQMHQVINVNADGVNRSALKVRRDTDLLLSLGISDPYAAKAGSLSQEALELANARRGRDMAGDLHTASPEERAAAVAKAMALVVRAEMLLDCAKRRNKRNIGRALEYAKELAVVRSARQLVTLIQQ